MAQVSLVWYNAQHLLGCQQSFRLKHDLHGNWNVRSWLGSGEYRYRRGRWRRTHAALNSSAALFCGDTLLSFLPSAAFLSFAASVDLHPSILHLQLVLSSYTFLNNLAALAFT
mgnify:CR=1 FL=1